MTAALSTLATLFNYTDWSTTTLLARTADLTDEQLDRPLDIGRGALRVNLTHTLVGESVWLDRWKQTPNVPWPAETAKTSPADLLAQFQSTWAARHAFFATLTPYHLAREQVYRDSKGSLFTATLADMIIQGLMHTKHHQAQSVNMIRRVGGQPPELDYMYRVRRPA